MMSTFSRSSRRWASEMSGAYAHVSASAPASLIERRNALIRSSALRSSRISSTTARYSRSSSRVCTGGGLSSGRSSASTRRRPRESVCAAPITARCKPVSATAVAPPGRRTRSATSATVPTFAYSCSCLGTRRTRSSSPASTVSVTVMPGNTTVSSSGTSRRSLTISSLSIHVLGIAIVPSPNEALDPRIPWIPGSGAGERPLARLSAGVDPGPRLEVEEVQPACVHHEHRPFALAARGAALDAGDERAAVTARLLLGGLERLAADDLSQLVGLHGRRLDGEMEEDLVAHVLLDVDRDRETPAGRRVAAAGVREILRADPERDTPPDVAPELRPLRRHVVRDGELVRAEGDNEAAASFVELRLDEVHRGRADEAGDEEVRRAVVQHLRTVDLLEEPGPQHADAVAERHRLALVVRDVDRRHLEAALDPRDLGAHLHAQLRVEVREGLVHQERLRLANDRPPHRDTLPLAAGQVPRPLLQHLREPQNPRRILDAPADFDPVDSPHLQAEAHVVEHVHVRVEGVVLEDHRHVARLRRQVVDDVAADADHSRRDLLEAGDHPQRARLPATGGPDEDHELPVFDLEVELVDRASPVGVDLRQPFELDGGHGPGTLEARSAACDVTR